MFRGTVWLEIDGHFFFKIIISKILFNKHIENGLNVWTNITYGDGRLILEDL